MLKIILFGVQFELSIRKLLYNCYIQGDKLKKKA